MIIKLPKEKTGIYFSLLFLLIGLISIYTFFNPLVISIDSIYGFLAYKGTLITGSFNVIADVSTTDINHINKLFVSWWSPGQWMFPGLLTYLFGFPLGISMIIITVVFAISGFLGYYRLFNFFNFPAVINLVSLLLICASATFYYSYIIYQGGEILAFGIFPWFLFYLLKLKTVSMKNMLLLLLLFLCCFLAKTTLIIYGLIAVVYKLAEFHVNAYDAKKKFTIQLKSVFILLLPVMVGLGLIYFLFLSRGIKPTIINGFNLSVNDILIPLSSPLLSILSVQQYITRLERFFFVNYDDGTGAFGFQSLLNLVCFLVVLVAAFAIYRQQEISRKYKLLLLFLYAGMAMFFIFSYAFDTNIDYSARHFKLLGFIFLPGLVNLFLKQFGYRLLNLAVVLFCLLGIADVAFIKTKWTKNRYLSENYIYRNYDNLEKIDSLDKFSYLKLQAYDDQLKNIDGKPLIFYVESNEDVEMDMKHLTITQKPGEALFSKIYYGNGPALIACISKETLLKQPDLLKIKFPGYTGFSIIFETTRYQFLQVKN